MAAFAVDVDFAEAFSVAAWFAIRSLAVFADVFVEGVARLAVLALLSPVAALSGIALLLPGAPDFLAVAADFLAEAADFLAVAADFLAVAADFLAVAGVFWVVDAFDAIVNFCAAARFAACAFLVVALLDALDTRGAGAVPFTLFAADDFAGALAAALVPLTLAAALVPLILVAVLLAVADFTAAVEAADFVALVFLVLLTFLEELAVPLSAFAVVARLPLVALAATALSALTADLTLVATLRPSLPSNHRACGDERIAVLPNAPYIDAPQSAYAG
ncbi:MAG: hypothetical protein H0V49_10640 [Nocardioidaceae bacterium]|nr:hypothetical protein [Nocardioidaceae bacterium]